MFDEVAGRYDVINDVLSLGLDRWWRRRAIGALGSAPEDWALDLGCGTGGLTFLLSRKTRVVGVDVSAAMLQHAERAARGTVRLVQGSAFRLPFRDGVFGNVASAFVLRNLDDLPAAFAELARVTSPSGNIALLDATEPRGRVFRRLFDAYFTTVAPLLGRLAGRPDAYRYLAGSLGQIPPPPEVCRLLRQAGFGRCQARPLTLGAVVLFTATRTPIKESTDPP